MYLGPGVAAQQVLNFPPQNSHPWEIRRGGGGGGQPLQPSLPEPNDPGTSGTKDTTSCKSVILLFVSLVYI